MVNMLALFLHGDLEGEVQYGWQGFAFVALLTLALCLGFNQLAKAALTKLNKKRGRHAKNTRKTKQA
jgi:cytochrome b